MSNILSVIDDFAACNRIKSYKCPAEGSFAAAALPYQAQSFSLINCQADIIHSFMQYFLRSEDTPGTFIVFLQFFCLYQDIFIACQG